MDRKRVYYIIEWVVALAACGWLVWKLATYDDYGSLWEAFRGMDCARVCAFLICIALMPVNMGLEAWRWHSLMNEGVKELKNEGISFLEAHYQVYYSKLAGLITPWRLGEYPSRAILMAENDERLGIRDEGLWSRVLSMGAVGSATMTIAIVVCGLLALSLEIGDWRLEIGHYWILVVAVLLLLVVGLALAPRMLRRWATVSHGLIIKSVGQSVVRLACWCVQLALVLYALGAISDQYSVFSTPIYYLLVTITPNVPIAEVGIRGFWAMQVFGTMNATLAGVVLWGVNTLLPCLIWPFLRKNEK